MRNEKFDWFQKNRVGTANQHSTYAWKSWHLVGFEPTMRLQPYAIQIPYAIQKGIWSIFGRKKVYFLIPTSEKSWHLVGFEPTLFGRAKVQPHYAYQLIARNAYGLYLTGKRCIFLYPHLKNLAPGGIWTHTVRAGEGATTLRVSVRLQSTPSLVVSLLSVAAVWLERYWPDS